MLKEQLKNPDYVLLAAATTMLILGILILSSASALLSQSRFHDSYYLIKHQLLHGILPGLILGLIAYKIPLGFLRKFAPLLLLGTAGLLLLIFISPLGFSAGGAQRWIHLGFVSVQPSEILKLTFIIYLASWLSSRAGAAAKKSAKGEFKITLAGFLVVIGIIGILLIKQPDLSTFGVVTLTAFGMYFLAGTPLKHTFFIILLGIGALLLLVYHSEYRLERFSAWLSPEADPMGSNFQSTQALIITGSGGVLGQGFGSSSQKYALLPELIGDSIFAPYAQEVGFAGGVLLVALFSIFVWRGFYIARGAREKFDFLTASGITIWIALQSTINISSTTGIIPLSGIPLPFISYGGTAIAVELAAVGLILNISRRVRQAD
jgi:cell division protein FtsW